MEISKCICKKEPHLLVNTKKYGYLLHCKECDITVSGHPPNLVKDWNRKIKNVAYTSHS